MRDRPVTHGGNARTNMRVISARNAIEDRADVGVGIELKVFAMALDVLPMHGSILRSMRKSDSGQSLEPVLVQSLATVS